MLSASCSTQSPPSPLCHYVIISSTPSLPLSSPFTEQAHNKTHSVTLCVFTPSLLALDETAMPPQLAPVGHICDARSGVDCSGCLAGERADERGRDQLKDSDYCFPLSLIEALERKDFNLLLLGVGTVIAQARRSGGGLFRGGQAENLCAIPMPPLKSARQSLHHHLLLHHAVIWSSPKGWAEAAAPHPVPCGLEGSNLQLGHRRNSYTDSQTPFEWILTEEEKLQILHSEEFASFFDQSARIIERALSEHVDIFFDYSGRDLEEKEGEIQAGTKLSLNRQFMDEHWSKHRVVTCLDWSLQYPELLVASYNNNEEAPHEPDGVALVWNMKYKKATPEYVFHCQSAVMSAAFAKFHPNVVVGGTYSGQIVLWDNRSNKRTPVQRTPLSAAAHTHPVYCVNVVGTQNAHNLISISTDGKICSWSLDMLSQPQDSMELVFKQSKAVAVTSMSFPLGDVNNFVVGSEDGSVYMSCRHGRCDRSPSPPYDAPSSQTAAGN
ncbi:hypothetical protein XENORESO_003562 [Xenotaenia resolanae]|uniref:Uncharacterized protein n=1 Tax=Xenotaenia resolanae TaxID=208358 RepID=A0ABV0WG35_9TELE